MIEGPHGTTEAYSPRVASVVVSDGRATSVTIRNVPSYLHLRDAKAIVAGLGGLTLDVAFGGNVYAILPAVSAGLAARADLHDRSRPRITGWAGNGPARTR